MQSAGSTPSVRRGEEDLRVRLVVLQLGHVDNHVELVHDAKPCEHCNSVLAGGRDAGLQAGRPDVSHKLRNAGRGQLA